MNQSRPTRPHRGDQWRRVSLVEIPTPDGGFLWADSTGTGQPVVLISGMSQDHSALVAQRPLAEDFQLIWMDNRGTGKSSDWVADAQVGLDPPTTGDFAQDVITVLDALGIRKAHVVGFSMGSRVAQWVAIRFPKRVGSLVLIGSSPGEVHGIPRQPDIDNALGAGDQDKLSLLNFSPAWMKANPETVRTILAATSERSHQRSLHYNAVHTHEAWNSLPAIKAPTLIIHGTEDKINPFRNAELLHERIHRSELMVVEGGRHAVGAEFADVVNARIAQFIREHPIAS